MKTQEEMRALATSGDHEALYKAIMESFTEMNAPHSTKRMVTIIFNHAEGMKGDKNENSLEVLSKACGQMFATWRDFSKGRAVQ